MTDHYNRWSKEFLEAGKERLLGDTHRAATSDEVTALRQENARLKELMAETLLENRVLKKSVTGSGSGEADMGGVFPLRIECVPDSQAPRPDLPLRPMWCSLPPTGFATRPTGRTNSGRPISPTCA